MTREEIIDGLKAVRTIHNGNYAPQIDEAIKSLNMWDKVVELINTKYGHILKATKYGNENVEQQSFSYSNVLMYEVADILDDILDDIKKYKKEIE